ncbi:Thymidylate kinase [Candidatus Desulfarcum epimagneticum]|uniref:Thymidylate kinase n=1 Tax=uncultured Desulfobacteraceae bacterium TaxID=218296 RepID=A0A484HN10_9BACT|nr:Thymidylate kinase [uncultured Desulfobacteraceae bacterium]
MSRNHDLKTGPGPLFITLEGVEGSGKTSQAGPMSRFLEKKGRRCVVTREPGGTGAGMKIRDILLDPDGEPLDSDAELLLYMADRAQHAARLIRPALASGKSVICDRYFDATLAYQGFARGIDPDWIRELFRRSVGDLTPDATFLLDLSPKEGLKRALKRDRGRAALGQGDETRFEKEALAFHEKVREGYLKLAVAEPRRFFVIDALADQAGVFRQIEAALEGLTA